MSDPAFTDVSLQDAQSLFQAGRFQEAARLFHDILRTNPRHFEALESLGRIYFHSGQFDQAQYLLGEAVLIDPANIEDLCIRGIALMRLQRRDDALSCFDRALAI